MQILNSTRVELASLRKRKGNSQTRRWTGVVVAGAAASVAGASGFAAAIALLPPHLAFPLVALGLLVTAATLALLALAAPREVGPARLLYWDFSGALALIGLAAALFGEPEQAVALLERDR